jgi:hypothetical protein
MESASRVRGVLPATGDDLESLRERIAKLEKRVATLERKGKTAAKKSS